MNPIRTPDINGCDEITSAARSSPVVSMLPLQMSDGPPPEPAQLHARPQYLQAQFDDGTTFVVQAPAAFTQEEVLRFAAKVTYMP